MLGALRSLLTGTRKIDGLQASLVPPDTMQGRALIAVIAIMTFLASLTAGGVIAVRTMASDWTTSVAREMTIQIRPTDGRDINAEVKKAADIARRTKGIAEVQAYSREESARLLEPWLGSGLKLDDMPVPSLIVLKISPDARPDLTALRRQLSEGVAGASLDDHRGWTDKLSQMANTFSLGGTLILILVLAATVLSVIFATRGAMAANAAIVEVLHFIGAKDAFIARQFARHFLVLGLKGGLIGAGAASLTLLVLESLMASGRGALSAAQVEALLGGGSLGVGGYLAVMVLAPVVGVVAAFTSRLTVFRTLHAID